MADTATKELVITLKGKDDGTGAMLDNASRKVETLDRQLKSFGRASDLQIAKKASDVAEGLNVGGFVGRGGAVLGAVGVAGMIGSTVERSARSVDAAVTRFGNGESGRAVAADVVRQVPGLGQATKAWDALREASDNALAVFAERNSTVKSFVDFANSARDAVKDWTGGLIDLGRIAKTLDLGQVTEEGKKIDAANGAFRARRNDILGIISKGEGHTPINAEESIAAKRDAELAKIDKAQKDRVVSDIDAEKARAVVIGKSEADLTAARQDAAQKRLAIATKEADTLDGIYRDAGKTTAEFQIALAEQAGDTTAAALLKVRETASEQIDAIKKEIRDLQNDPTLDPTFRQQAIGAHQRQIDAINTTEGGREKMIVGAGRANIDQGISKIRSASLANEVALGNKAAETEARRMAIAEKYKQQREEIDRLEKDSSITAAQRNELERQRLGLSKQEQAEQAKAARDAELQRIRSLNLPTSQLDNSQDPKILDGRGQTGYLSGLADRNNAMWAATVASAKATEQTAKNTDRMTALLDGILKNLANDTHGTAFIG